MTDAPAKPAKPPALLLSGIPDNHTAKAFHVAWDKRPSLVMPGTASFLNQLRDLPLALTAITLGGNTPLSARMKPVPSVNFMADADLYPTSLQQAAELVDHLGTPCFNHPSRVLATTRDGVARMLAGIPGLHVPRTVRAQVATTAELRAAIEQAGMGFPVIVRMAGDHGGVTTARVQHNADWAALNPLPWGGKPIYLTEYVDYADADGLYRKMRVVVVGRQVLVRHRITSAQWMVHRKVRVPGSDAEEAAFMGDFGRAALPALERVMQAMAERLQLDLFGADISLRPDGSVLLFEANACMNLLTQAKPSPPWEAAVVAGVAAALQDALAQPAQWRHTGSKA